MDIDTKFDINQDVYDKDDKCLRIVDISGILTGEKFTVKYKCNDEKWYEENELYSKRRKMRPTFDIEMGEEYWFINEKYKSERAKYQNDLIGSDDYVRKYHGNIFFAKEDADDEITYRSIHQKLKNLSGNNGVFQRGKVNYFLCYNTITKHVEVVKSGSKIYPGIVYFKTDLAAKNAIDQIDSVTLIKKYFKAEKR